MSWLRSSLLALAVLASPVAAQAAAIEHAVAEITSNVSTTSSSFTGVTGASLSSGSFTAGKKYLVRVVARFAASSTVDGEVRVVHGTTGFAGSQSWLQGGNSGNSFSYQFVYVWTAVSSEGLALQFRSRTGGNTINCDFASVFVMNLSDALTENTDWVFNENTTATTVDATLNTYKDGASVTFTPSGSSDWLVLSTVRMDAGAQASNYPLVRLNSGGATTPLGSLDIFNSGLDELVYGLERVFSLTATSTTMKAQYAASANAQSMQHLNSTIFALNLSKFKTAASAYTDGTTNLSATNFATNLQALAITPAVQGDVWIGGMWSFSQGSATRTAKQRLQVDSSDAPAGQTAAAYVYTKSSDPRDEGMYVQGLVSNMTAASHTVNLDGSADSTTGTPLGRYRTLWAVTMELASSGGGGLLLRGVGP